MTEVKKTGDPAVLECFENMCVEDLIDEIPLQLIEHVPIVFPLYRKLGELVLGHYEKRSRMVQWVKNIASDGDPDRIDPGIETKRIGELFSAERNDSHGKVRPFGQSIIAADVEAYYAKYLEGYWSGRRDLIANNYGIESSHPLFKAFEGLKVGYVTNLRSLRALTELGGVLPEILPHIKEKGSLNVLYPGSGSHIAPIATAMKLIDDGVIKEATFTYTEIKEWPADAFKELFEVVLKQGIFQSFSYSDWVKFKSEGKDEGSEMDMIIGYKGRPIHVKFALNRSGEDFYREEYFRDADLVVIHDTGPGGCFEDAADLFAKMLLHKREAFPEKEQVIVMEGEAIATDRGPGYDPFPEGIKQWVIPGQYGHCDGYNGIGEVKDCTYRSARVILLNDPKLLDFASRYSDYFQLSRAIYQPPPRVYFSVPQPE